MHFDTASPHLYSSRQSAHSSTQQGIILSVQGISPSHLPFPSTNLTSRVFVCGLFYIPKVCTILISIPVFSMDRIPILSWLHWDIPFRLHFLGHLLTRKAKVVASDLTPSKFGHNLDGLTTNFLTHLTGSKSGS